MASSENNLVFIKVRSATGETKQAYLDKSLAEMLQSESCDEDTKRYIIEAIQTDSDNNNNVVCKGFDGNKTNKEDVRSCEQQVHIWTENEEKLLISLRGEKECSFNSARNHEILWEEITNEICLKGIKVTKAQVMNKWKNMKKKYKELIDNAGKTGSSPITWKHMETFNILYGHKSSTRPAVVLDTGDPKKATKTLPVNLNQPSLSTAHDTSTATPDPSTGPSAKKKRRIGKQSDKEKLLQHLEKIDERQEKALQTFEKHHKQKMEKMDRLLDIFESAVKK